MARAMPQWCWGHPSKTTAGPHAALPPHAAGEVWRQPLAGLLAEGIINKGVHHGT